jgi:hypothetical protein
MPYRLSRSIQNAIAAETPNEALDALQNVMGSLINVMNIAQWNGSEPFDLRRHVMWHKSVSASFCKGHLALVAECGSSSLARWITPGPVGKIVACP